MARMLFLRDIDVDVHLRCRACGHGGALPRAMLERRFGPNYPVLSIAPHYRCSRCDSRDTESRPAPVDSLRRNSAAGPAADPSFDAPLAALQGLLASVRGPETEGRSAATAPPTTPWSGPDDLDDPLPAFKPFAPPAGRPAESDLAENDPTESDLADTDPDDGDWAGFDPAESGWPEPEPAPARKGAAAGKATRALEELVADGPADEDAAPLWEPVSLADMAARLEGTQDGAAPPFDADDAETDDAPFDETVAAMRRFFAEAELEEDDLGPPPAWQRASATAAEADRAAEDDLAGEEDGDDAFDPPVFSHKALVRNDFDEDPDILDGFGEPGEDDRAADPSDDEEPTDEDILSFAIRDPEKPAAPPPKAERGAKPSADSEEEGFDKTLAALRSMIEDAAVEPKVVPVRRKARPEPAPEPLPEAVDDWQDPTPAPPEEEPPAKPPARTGGRAPKASAAKRSAQEREIEEAMKALRDLVEDDAPPRSAQPLAQPPAPRGRKGIDRAPIDDAAIGRPLGDPLPDSLDDAPPDDPAPPAGKKRAESDGSPLSKTIAALRGMLELDGRRKR